MNDRNSVSSNSETWRAFVALGIALIALGGIAWLEVGAVKVASAVVIGSLLVIGGVVQIVHAFVAKQWRGFVLSLLCGAFYAIGGLLTMWEPVHGAVVLTLLIVTTIMVSGALRIVMSFRNRDLRGWGLVLFGGVVSIVVGSLIYASLPWSTLWILGILIAIELFVQGGGWLYFGLALRTAREALLGTGAGAPQ